MRSSSGRTSKPSNASEGMTLRLFEEPESDSETQGHGRNGSANGDQAGAESSVATLNGSTYSPEYCGPPFVEFDTVTADTCLQELNLNWRERDLPERQRTKHVHRLHPYLGKFIPQLVEIFLRKYFSPGMIVADPFAGSGTTLVQANELGIRSIGYDISAFNVLLMNAKTASCDPTVLRQEVHDALARTRSLLQEGDALPIFEETPHETEEPDSEYLRRWFAPEALRELIAFRHVICTQRYSCEDVLKILLSRSARSARLTTHFDLDFPREPVTEPYFCYKHRRICEPTRDAFKFLIRYSQDTIKRVAEFQKFRTDASLKIIHGDSRQEDIPKIDGVFTSPPYVGLIDYHEQHAYAYHLFGLKDRRSEEIGAAVAGSSLKARQQYMEDIAAVLGRFLDRMPKGGPLIIVAGDKHNLYPRIAQMLNVHVEGVVERHVNRRTGRRSTPFFESVFVWRKR